MNAIWPALSLGFLGSLHCVLMCAPLLSAIPFGRGSNLKAIYRHTGYQIGRIVSYIIIGLVFYLLGTYAHLAGWQKGLSVFIGAVLLSFVLLNSIGKHNLRFGFTLYQYVLSPFRKLVQSGSAGSRYLLGMINGFLPCGLVYLAAFTAIAQSDVQANIQYMLFFGIGTLPLLLLSLFGYQSLLKTNSRLIKRGQLLFIGVLGVLFIIRGMGLDIPYLSPALDAIGFNPAECRPGLTD